jgi:hypothetical protein
VIKAKDAIRVARSLIGTPYSELDCINLIKKVIRIAPGGVPGYTTAGTNSLWRSYDSSPKYKDLTWRQMSIAGAKPGMLAFKINGENIHHVGIVTESDTVIHSSSAKGEVVETPLDKTWDALAIHRYIGAEEAEEDTPMYKAEVNLNSAKSSLNLRNGPSMSDMVIGSIPHGAVVDVLVEADKWCYVRYNSTSGYAAAEYLERVSEDVEEERTEENTEVPTPAFTTFMKDDGTMIRLEGAWRVAED